MFRWSSLVCWGLMTLVGAAAPADDPRPRHYEQIVAEFDQAREAANRAYTVAKTEEEQRAIQRPRAKDYAPRLMELAETQPDDATARRAMIWVLEHNVETGFDKRYAPLVVRATELLLRFHKDEEAVGVVLLKLTDIPSPPRDQFLRAMVEQTTNRVNQGRACLALAEYLKMKGYFIQQLRNPAYQSEDPVWTNQFYGTAYLAALKAVDPGPLLAESERLYERVLAEYAEIEHLPAPRHPGRIRPLGELANSGLDELRHLVVGQPAPEVDGRDVADRPMTLSEHRGKVVVLVFWGSWCGACMAQIPHEKLLAERMKDRPFALLGVNSDESRDTAETVADREGITWRSWFDGGTVGGPIARRWNVPFWPMINIIDHKGVIRAREVVDTTFLDKLVDELVAEAEKEATPPQAPGPRGAQP